MCGYCWYLGGLTNYIQKVKTGRTDKFSIIELIGEICVSVFVGVVTFWLCELSDFPSLLTAALGTGTRRRPAGVFG